MIGILNRMSVIWSNIFSYSSLVGRGDNGIALSFLTALAAIIYILSSTLGSGSYMEVLSFIGQFLRVVVFISLGITILVFSSSLTAYLDKNMNIEEISASKKHVQRLFPTKYLPAISFISLAPATILLIWNFYTIGWYGILSKLHTEIILFGMFFVLSVWFIALVERIISGNSSVLYHVILYIVYICSVAVSYNVYRDSYKESFNTNTQYCYWISTSLDDESYKNNFGNIDRKLCNALDEKNISYRFIRNRPF